MDCGKGVRCYSVGAWRKHKIDLQQKSKNDFDSRKCGKEINVHAGDWVKIRDLVSCAQDSRCTGHKRS